MKSLYKTTGSIVDIGLVFACLENLEIQLIHSAKFLKISEVSKFWKILPVDLFFNKVFRLFRTRLLFIYMGFVQYYLAIAFY